jgi:hypothetical protein
MMQPAHARSAIKLSVVLLVTAHAFGATPAFPGAEGYGALATGGRGGSVYHVTRLDDALDGSGNPVAGTFRWAVNGSNRIVVFDVGGVINISSKLGFNGNNITVAGQTAPGGGIAVYGDGVSLSNRSNIVLRYMSFRQGINSDTDTKALNITNGQNMIVDHCSMAWSRYDNLGISAGASDITIQNCISCEGINDQRSGGFVSDVRDITLARNLFTNNQTRNPKGKADMQYVNNVVYNWRYGGYVGGHSSGDWYQDLIGNYFIKGRSSENNEYVTDFASTDKIYNQNNFVDLDETDAGNDKLPEGSLVSNSAFTSRSATIMSSPHNAPDIPVTVTSALDAYEWIVAQAGNSRFRDGVDLRQIQHLQSQGVQGGVIADETWVGGMPAISGGVAPNDTDRDGIPDAWELAHGLNSNLASDGSSFSGTTGYTNVEVYLNSLAAAPVPEPAAATVIVILATASALARRRSSRS